MTFNFKDLIPDFATKAEQLLDALQEGGLTFQPTSGLRTVESQANLWRQSRTKAVINQKLQELRDAKCDYLASVIEGVGAQYGPHVTNAIPGLSAHNWGEAMDCSFINIEIHPGAFEPLPDNTKIEPLNSMLKPIKVNYYKILADKAVELGLCAGYYFKSFPDPGHIQYHTQEILQRMTLQQVNDEMKKRFK